MGGPPCATEEMDDSGLAVRHVDTLVGVLTHDVGLETKPGRWQRFNSRNGAGPLAPFDSLRARAGILPPPER